MSAATDHLYRLVGKRISRARGHMSQTRLAQLVGLTRGSIANIEIGRQHAPLHTIWELASKLQVDARALLPDAEEMLAEPPLSAEVNPASKRLARVAGAGLPKVQQFIQAKKAEVTNEPQTTAGTSGSRAARSRTAARVRTNSAAN